MQDTFSPGIDLSLPGLVLVITMVPLALFLWKKGLTVPAVGVSLLLGVVLVAGWIALSRSRGLPSPAPASEVNQPDLSTTKTSQTSSFSETPEVLAVALPWSSTIEGTWKKSREEAVNDALDEAQKQTVACLRSHNPQLAWVPSVEYVREHLLKNSSDDETSFGQKRGKVATTTVQRLDQKRGKEATIWIGDHTALEQDSDFEDLGNMRKVRLKVAISEKDMQEMLHLDRQVRAGQRQYTLLKILAGLVAIMTTVAVYSRLQDTTKGHYAWLLRLAAVGFVGSVGAILLKIN